MPLDPPSVLAPRDDQELVFHYTTLATALEHILPYSRLRMGRFRNTADPRESKDWNLGVTTSGPNADSSRALQIERQVWDEEKHAQDSLRVLCLSEDALPNGPNTAVEERGFGLAMMWDRYGDRHLGVCLALDRAALEVELRHMVRALPAIDTHITRGERVRYGLLASDEHRAAWDVDGDAAARDGIEQAVLAHITQHYKELLFFKSRDWQAEREFRWVFLAERGTGEVYIPVGKALRAIFLGYRFGAEIGSPIRLGIARLYPDVEVYEMHFDRGHFQRPRIVDAEGAD